MVCKELCEDVVWPEGDGHSVEDGGNEWFGVGGFFGVYICCVPDFCVVILQYLLPSRHWYCVVFNDGVVARDCFGQLICPLISFQACVSFYPVKGDRGGRPMFYCFPSSVNG